MTSISVPVPPSLQMYREPLREFFAGMMRKLDKNSHKKTPTTNDIPTIVGLLRDEISEFEDQMALDPMDSNTLMELIDTANFAFLAFVACRIEGVLTDKEKMIREFLTIDPLQGKVYCAKTRAGSQYRVGEEVKGTRRNGYVDIKLQSRATSSHGSSTPRSHLVWWQHTGSWPTGVIDHINRIRDDDRVENLRDVSFSDNAYNKERKSTLPSGVTQYLPSGRSHLPHYGKYVYQKYHRGTNIRCAYYDSPEEAAEQGRKDWEEKVNV